MHEQYHEAFWVVAGAAAPVIALAVAVGMADLGRTITTPRISESPYGWVLALLLSIGEIVFIMMAVVLVLTLVSLGRGQDFGPLWVTGVLLVSGLFLAVWPGSSAAVLRNWWSELPAGGKSEGGEPAEDDRPDAPG